MLGARVKDTITGFEGIATGRSEFLNGCVSICIAASELSKDGEPKIEWFDEQRLEVIDPAAFKPNRLSTATAGGPQPTPPPDGAM